MRKLIKQVSEVVGSTIPVYGRSQAKEPREFIVNVDEDDIV